MAPLLALGEGRPRRSVLAALLLCGLLELDGRHAHPAHVRRDGGLELLERRLEVRECRQETRCRGCCRGCCSHHVQSCYGELIRCLLPNSRARWPFDSQLPEFCESAIWYMLPREYATRNACRCTDRVLPHNPESHFVHRNLARIPPSHVPPSVAGGRHAHIAGSMVVSSRHGPCSGHAH